MACALPFDYMEKNVSCPICKGRLTHPVTTECGHNFCRACISGYYASLEEEGPLNCPLCRAPIENGNFRPNLLLAELVENVVQNETLPQESGNVDLCGRHREQIHLFCKEDRELLCLVCEKSPEHRGHTVVTMEEAAQHYKNQISSSLDLLKQKKELIMAHKANTEKESQDMLMRTKAEQQKALAEFRHIREFLDGHEKLLLSQMAQVEKEVLRRKEEHMAKLSRELSSLDNIMQEMETTSKHLPSTFLKDVRSTFKRYVGKAKFETPEVFPPALKWRIWEFREIYSFLEVLMQQFKDSLVSGLRLQKANVILDPSTAHPQLVLSEDHKSVKWGDKRQKLGKDLQRFDKSPLVMGCEEFMAGRHFWDISVGYESEWAVGVIRKTVNRKGNVVLNNEAGVWAIKHLAEEYWATLQSDGYRLKPSRKPKKIRVTLNYPAGRVAFFDADTAARLFVFSKASFSGESLHPFFYVCDNGHLTLCP